MALTNEERLDKLKQHENWWSFTDCQRIFLSFMAQEMEPVEAAKKAWPECKNYVVMLRSQFARAGIQSALESIGLDKSRPNISKNEALKQLSRYMRLSKDATEYCKLLAQYSKLQGWDDEDGEKDPDDAMSLDKLVAAMEKKRKKNGA